VAIGGVWLLEECGDWRGVAIGGVVGLSAYELGVSLGRVGVS